MGLCINFFGIPVAEDKECREQRSRNKARKLDAKGDKRVDIIHAKGDRDVQQGIGGAMRLQAGGSNAADIIGATASGVATVGGAALGAITGMPGSVPASPDAGNFGGGMRQAAPDNTLMYAGLGLAALGVGYVVMNQRR